MFCRHCTYPLSRLETQICPECGHKFDPFDSRSFDRRRGRTRRRRRTALGIGGVLAVLAVYVASYFALVVRPSWGAASGVDPAVFGGSRVYKYWLSAPPKYRVPGSTTKTIFAPIHAIDRMLRRNLWEREYNLDHPNSERPLTNE